MHLLQHYMIEERASIMEHGFALSMIGRREGMPADVLREIDKTDRVQPRQHRPAALPGDQLWRPGRIGRRGPRDRPPGPRRRLGSRQVTEQTLSDHLYTAGMSDPDLLIRTASEMRISNFLLWQISYAEIWVTDRCWPEFDEALLRQAIRDFAARNRRFGGLSTYPAM